MEYTLDEKIKLLNWMISYIRDASRFTILDIGICGSWNAYTGTKFTIVAKNRFPELYELVIKAGTKYTYHTYNNDWLNNHFAYPNNKTRLASLRYLLGKLKSLKKKEDERRIN